MERFIKKKSGVARLAKAASVLNPWDMEIEEPVGASAGEGGEV